MNASCLTEAERWVALGAIAWIVLGAAFLIYVTHKGWHR